MLERNIQHGHLHRLPLDRSAASECHCRYPRNERATKTSANTARAPRIASAADQNTEHATWLLPEPLRSVPDQSLQQ